uniref:Adenosine kinase n=1 Tax=Phlebotomus papatasi TaxID=29031 RepID=A0A1B0D5Y5_PHLPP
MSIAVDDESIRMKYNLKANDQLEIPIETLMAVKKDAEERYQKTVQFNPGGSSLNTCRILRALGEENVLFCGSVGKDVNGEKLLKLIQERCSTAVCLCLIEGSNRCLIANIGAAFRIELSWLSSEAFDEVCLARIFYIEGYFVPERFHICQWLVEKIGKTGKLAINLNAKYIVESLKEEFKFLLKACDLIFGNTSEFSTLIKVSGYTSLTSCVDLIAKDTDKDKILVITDGEHPVKLIEIKNKVVKLQEIQVEKVDNVQDTTGAGDAFVAGFFFAYIRDRSPWECVQEGISVARRTITQIGCYLPEMRK